LLIPCSCAPDFSKKTAGTFCAVFLNPSLDTYWAYVGGGVFTLSDLAVSGDHIFVSNMVFADGIFKVYHWAGVNAEPVVLLEYANAPARLGDAFTVIGNPEEEALLIVSGHGSQNFYVWTIQNSSITNTIPEVYTFETVPNVNFGRVTKVPGEDLFLASGSGFGLLLLDNQMNILAQLQAGFFPYWSMYPQIFYYNNQRFLAYIHVKDAPAENMFYVLDISDGANALEAIQSLAASTFAQRLVHGVSLGTVSNGNASVGLDLINDNSGNVWAMTYAAGNGFIVQKFGDFPTGISKTPRAIAEVNVYPNPASTYFIIQSENRIGQVFIYDLTGRLVENKRADENQVIIDAGNYINGVYIINVHSDKGIASRKLIIQK